MSTLEKSLYKNLKIQSQRVQNKPIISKSYKGISTVNPLQKTFNLYDLELIKQDIVNHFHIRLGEKLENPTFGTIIWDVLFEPFTDDLRQVILQDVQNIINYDPRVSLQGLTVDEYEYGIQIRCELIYLDYSISEFLQLRFDRNNGLL